MTTPKTMSGPPANSLSLSPFSIIVALLLSVVTALVAIEEKRLSLEENYQMEMSTDVKWRAFDIMFQTMNGNVMGALSTMGLVNRPIKDNALGKSPPDSPLAMEPLQANGKVLQANGMYVANAAGIIQTCYYTIGTSNTGVDVRFRPYFQMAMQGKQCIYAAIGTITGEPALYFAAPVYEEVSVTSPIIGAVVGRLSIERIDAVLKAWPGGPALLLSPQQVIFACSRQEWTEKLVTEATPEQIRAIRDLKQFGNTFDNSTPQVLPFDLGKPLITIDSRRYAVERAPVHWNDPQGEWTLVILGDLDHLMPLARQVKIGVTVGVGMFFPCILLLLWHGRFKRVTLDRQRVEAELATYTRQLELDSSIKSQLGKISMELHQASTITEFAQIFLFHASDLLGIEYGVFYVLKADTGMLVPAAGHGTPRPELEPVAIGQGLVGQCAKDLVPIFLSDALETNIRIRWGGGEIAPKTIILLPICHARHLLGVLVLAGLQPMDASKRTLVDAILPMVAMSLHILERNVATVQQAETLKEQQVRLQETEAWYRGIFEAAPDGILVIDDHGNIILANPQVDAIFGYPTGALIGQKAESLVPDSVRKTRPSHHATHMKSSNALSKGSLKKQFFGKRKDGSLFPIDLGFAKLPALGGHGVCVCASIRDISERKAEEQLLADSEARLASILETSPVSIAFSTKDRIHFTNPLFVETFGAKAGDLSPHLYVRPEDRTALVERLQRGEVVHNFEVQMHDRTRTVRDMLVTYLPMTYGGETGVLGWLMDITDRKAAEKVIQERMHELERFSRLTIDREGKMIQLKQEVNALLVQLGKATKYKIVE